MRSRTSAAAVLPYVIALALAAFLVFVDQRSHENQVSVLALLLGAGLLGLVWPRRAWRWALIVGPGIAVFGLWAATTHARGVFIPEPGWYAGLIALIPAFIGAYAGSAVHWVLRQITRTA